LQLSLESCAFFITAADTSAVRVKTTTSEH
jgi:hypothetical protein